MFDPVPANLHFPDLEEEILAYWKQRGIYEQSLERRANAPAFVFYEGPPTANGMPHPGHCLTRAIKDLFPRYRTMRGYRCERKAGWDTHGLPVEVEVCKELGIHTKDEIENFGVEPFVHRCQQSVWRYMLEWEELTRRLGFWIHLDDAYATYRQSYVESVWWSLKTLFERNLLYQGHKIVWWWAQGGTALSSGEVGQGYRQVSDPSVFVRCPVVGEPASLLVWTTTPWTLPCNQFVAVHPELEYSLVQDTETDENFFIASALVDSIADKVGRTMKIVGTRAGSALIGKRYHPPFDYFYRTLGAAEGKLRTGGLQATAWRVVAADFVTVESGTGLVHQAPAFGEVDYEVFLAEQARFEKGQGPELICAVAPDGKFTDEVSDFAGRWVKEADKDIARDLRRRGLLYHQEQYVHDYPFCWRSEDDPLIQYPRKSWFIRTTACKDKMLANNQRVNWLPNHIRDGRFGNFLETNVDWALSRERYWGTPLPIWICDKSSKMEALASYDELLAKPGVEGMDVWDAAKRNDPDLAEDLKVHKPYIDAITYNSPYAANGRMRRVPEVIDCWYDSGAMPFAQWGYPHQGRNAFSSQFPADFISEAIDQTRGWFYSLLAISTLLFGDDEAEDSAATVTPFPHPYRNCIVLGLMLGEDGNKMSKSKRNYREPQEIFDRYGADALRWYFFSNQAPWTSIRYSERAIKESIPEFLLRLTNIYSFFVIYANIDGFDPAASIAGDGGQLSAEVLASGDGYRPINERGELDRWILSELNQTVDEVVQRMDSYDNYAACSSINEFVDGLSNWYVRRSRDRFWSGERHSGTKLDAYWTLYECLITTSKLIAPFVPFLAEAMWRNLAGLFGDRAVESVHLCDYPTGNQAFVDQRLSRQMRLAREVTSLGRRARMSEKLKVRQPLAKVEVVLADKAEQSWLEAHDALIQQELNVKFVDYTEKPEQYISYNIQPNFKKLGPKLGPLLPKLKQVLAQASGADLLKQLNDTGKISVSVSQQEVTLSSEDIQVRLQAKPGWAAAQGPNCVVILSTELSPELLREGLARDLIRLVQKRRKELNCQFTDRIQVGVVTDDSELLTALKDHRNFIMRETLSVQLVTEAIPDTADVKHTVSEYILQLYVKQVKPD